MVHVISRYLDILQIHNMAHVISKGLGILSTYNVAHVATTNLGNRQLQCGSRYMRMILHRSLDFFNSLYHGSQYEFFSATLKIHTVDTVIYCGPRYMQNLDKSGKSYSGSRCKQDPEKSWESKIVDHDISKNLKIP
mgnify:CR=1 FL=1